MPADQRQPAASVEGPWGDPLPGCILHIVPSGLLRGAQVSARGLVDELGGPAKGHVLVSMFQGDEQIAVDASVGLPGGEKAAAGIRVTALLRLWRTLRRWSPALVITYGGDAHKYAAIVVPAPSCTTPSARFRHRRAEVRSVSYGGSCAGEQPVSPRYRRM